MRTDDLIKGLSADTTSAAMPMSSAWRMGLAASVVIAILTFFVLLGPRSDIAEAMQTVRFPLKFVMTIALGLTAWGAAMALARPEGLTRRTALALAVAPVLLVVAIALEMIFVPADQWGRRLVGNNYAICMTFIPLIGIGPLAIFLAVLRHGAPVRPGLAGMLAGVLAGAVAATLYAAHCIDDSPLFVATWYTSAIALLAATGAIAARIVARW